MDRFDKIPYEDLSPETTWSRLGKGSFGNVYLGEYLGLQVAIKEVLESGDYDVDKYFTRECKIMQEARHPNIVQYLGLSLSPPIVTATDSSSAASSDNQTTRSKSPTPPRARILIISEYVARGNVRSYIHNTSLPFPWRLRVSFAVDVCRAVAYLHARNCLHRDLKGENLLVTENERVKVCDFGFARLAATTEMEMRRMSYCGTDGFMAPEIIMGDEFGLPADIYSLGVIFCEIISRTLVHRDVFKREMPSFGISFDEIRASVSPGCPTAFTELTLACLSLEPTERPPIRVILDRLRQIEAEVIAAEETSGYSVGSISFAGTTRRNGKPRPAAPRLPSFEGQVNVTRSTTEEDDIDVSMLALAETTVAGDGATAPDQVLRRTESFVDYSEQESFPPRRLQQEQLASTIGRSSIITIKGEGRHAPHLRQGSTTSSLPSIPSTWMNQPPPPPPPADSSFITAQASSLTVTDNGHSILSTPATKQDKSAAETEGEGEEEIFHSAFVDFPPALHRFSLVKPAWRLLSLKSNDPPRRVPPTVVAVAGALPDSKRISLEVRSSQEQMAGGGGAQCELCRKKFGFMKAYFQCDDCGYRCHLKCSDACPPFCGQTDDIHLLPLEPLSTTVPTSVPSRVSKLLKKVGGSRSKVMG